MSATAAVTPPAPRASLCAQRHAPAHAASASSTMARARSTPTSPAPALPVRQRLLDPPLERRQPRGHGAAARRRAARAPATAVELQARIERRRGAGGVPDRLLRRIGVGHRRRGVQKLEERPHAVNAIDDRRA